MKIEEHIENLKAIASDMPSDKCSDWIKSLMAGVKALEQEPCDDYISREETLKALMDEWTEYDSELMDYLIEKIKKLPSVTPQPKIGYCDWIPVSERLPDKLKDVLIAFADAPDEYEIAYLKATDNATYKENGAVNEWMTFAGTSYADYEVEAWMPIPPYQSEIPTGAEGSEE